MVKPPDARIHVRQFVSADRADVLALAERLSIGVAPWRGRDQVIAAARQWVEESIGSLGDDSTVLVAEGEQGERLGFVSVARKAHFTGDEQAYVGELVVSTSTEGRGVGRELMSSAEDWARDRDLRFIVLETGSQNERARAFYGKLGYQEESVTLTKVLT